ncbi:nitrogen regulation protein NR(I) [Chromatiales bacterium (ex Bugula neritina AB1)]|nr:nitrogen regulation protein NR(I) [Chromatiales bacterium (ex Bugula neritina AB1)]
MTRNCVWIVDDDQSIRWVLQRAFQQAEISVDSFESAEAAFDALQRHARAPDAIVSDVRMSGMSGLELLTALRETGQSAPPVIIITAHADLDTAVSAYEGGAFEYVPKPFDVDEVIEITRRAFSNTTRTANLITRAPKDQSGLVGESAPMQQLYRTIGRLARSHATVLINGETGSGKELIAKALHQHSPRSEEPFIALNMAAISQDLMEAELFGHEKGAFTGANEQRKGRFEQADNGTLFLDEIGDMPAQLQTRLLRVLSENQFFRVGGRTAISVDVRIIAATHQNLEAMVEKNLFREDLFHRLNVIRINAPALRERPADIPLLLKFFLHRAADELGNIEKLAAPELIQHLQQLSWPGNVRQLENLARWLTVMAAGQELQIHDLPPDLATPHNNQNISGSWTDSLQTWVFNAIQNKEPEIGKLASEKLEKILIASALQSTGNRKQEAALILGWGRNTLTRKMKEYGIK